MKKVQEPRVRKTHTVEPTVKKSLTVTSRVHRQLLIGLLAGIVVMSVVVLSGQELEHLPPAAPAFTVLHPLAGAPRDGAFPYAGLISSGNLYGTTYEGGSGRCFDRESGESGCGVVFTLSPAGTETVLHNFKGGDGANPHADLILDAAGNLYGTALGGGVEGGFCGGDGTCGLVFKLSPTGTETVLHSFTGGEDGANPLAGLLRDAAGNLYGTTYVGGAFSFGVVFELIRCSSAPSGYDFKVLYSFKGGADGANPEAGLIKDAAGNLYGTTFFGGVKSTACLEGASCGVVFKVSPSGTEKVLYSFTGPDGANPQAGLVRDAAGNLYGTTSGGGADDHGVVFELVRCSSVASGYEFKVLHTFTGYPTDGASPVAGLLRDAAGNLYGTTEAGGASEFGVVFKLSPTGTEKVLHSFTNGKDGATPRAGLIQDAVGSLYGTALGGAHGAGVVFKLTP